MKAQHATAANRWNSENNQARLNCRLVTAEDHANEQLRQLYETAFPEDEQIPWADLMRLIGEMSLDFTAYFDGNELIGFTIVYPRKSFSWFWYFAVREELRGRGYGQQILTQLIEKYKGQTFVLDMESPTQVCGNIEQRRRRHAFYLLCGIEHNKYYVPLSIMLAS